MICELMTARIKEGLDRLERYGEFDVHPSEDRKRHPEDNVNVVFDFSAVTDVDPRSPQTPLPMPLRLSLLMVVQCKSSLKSFKATAQKTQKSTS